MIRFSNSTLGTFEDCPRCFWLEMRSGIKRPRGIFPSLPGGVDRILKPYFDGHATKGTFPPEMAKLSGAMPYADRVKLESWRNWRNLQVEIDGIAMLSGALDELIIWGDGLHSPYDYKTRGAAPVEGASEEYYGTQLDIYHLLIEQGCKLKCNGDGYLGYYWPIEVTGHGDFKFATDVIKLTTDPSRAVKLVHDAVDCLALDKAPQAEIRTKKKGGEEIACEYCRYVASREAVGDGIDIEQEEARA